MSPAPAEPQKSRAPRSPIASISCAGSAWISQRGQESAVFELLIAVIVMTFVIVVGFNALDVLNRKVCEGQMNQALENIRTTVEEVVNTKNKANVSFQLPACYPEKDSHLRIVETDSAQQCSALCGGSIGRCTILTFDSPTYVESKCLRVSSATTFPEGEPCFEDMFEPQGGYRISNWKSPEGIAPGTYTLFKVSSLSSTRPEICAFRRV